MEIGMLWFDDSSRPLAEKIKRAVAFYADKYGQSPTHCLVHPKTLNGGEGTVSGVEVRKARAVMPDHFWVGVDEKAPSRRRARRRAA